MRRLLTNTFVEVELKGHYLVCNISMTKALDDVGDCIDLFVIGPEKEKNAKLACINPDIRFYSLNQYHQAWKAKVEAESRYPLSTWQVLRINGCFQ